jgi:stress-induced morphogen
MQIMPAFALGIPTSIARQALDGTRKAGGNDATQVLVRGNWQKQGWEHWDIALLSRNFEQPKFVQRNRQVREVLHLSIIAPIDTYFFGISIDA